MGFVSQRFQRRRGPRICLGPPPLASMISSGGSSGGATVGSMATSAGEDEIIASIDAAWSAAA